MPNERKKKETNDERSQLGAGCSVRLAVGRGEALLLLLGDAERERCSSRGSRKPYASVAVLAVPSESPVEIALEMSVPVPARPLAH